jgi:hypothetical protein
MPPAVSLKAALVAVAPSWVVVAVVLVLVVLVVVVVVVVAVMLVQVEAEVVVVVVAVAHPAAVQPPATVKAQVRSLPRRRCRS